MSSYGILGLVVRVFFNSLAMILLIRIAWNISTKSALSFLNLCVIGVYYASQVHISSSGMQSTFQVSNFEHLVN